MCIEQTGIIGIFAPTDQKSRLKRIAVLAGYIQTSRSYLDNCG